MMERESKSSEGPSVDQPTADERPADPTSSVMLFDLRFDQQQVLTLLDQLATENSDIPKVGELSRNACDRTRAYLEADGASAKVMLAAFVWDRFNETFLPVVCEPFTVDDTDALTQYAYSVGSMLHYCQSVRFELRAISCDNKLLIVCTQALIELFMLKEAEKSANLGRAENT